MDTRYFLVKFWAQFVTTDTSLELQPFAAHSAVMNNQITFSHTLCKTLVLTPLGYCELAGYGVEINVGTQGQECSLVKWIPTFRKYLLPEPWWWTHNCSRKILMPTAFHNTTAFLVQGPSTFSCNCVAKESNFPYAKNTFGWINVAAVRSHRGAIYNKVSDVIDEAPVSYFDE